MINIFFIKSVFVVLLSFFADCLLFLLIQKPLFMLYNWQKADVAQTRHELGAIYRHGLILDAATAGYLQLLPILVLTVAQVYAGWPFANVLTIYNVVIAILLALIVAADAILYGFWDSKIEASVLLYLDSPGKFKSVSTFFLIASVGGALLLACMCFCCLQWPYIWIPSNDLLPTSLWSRLGAALGMMILCIGLFFAVIRGGIGKHGKVHKPNTPAKVFYSSVPYFNHAALNPVFNFLYTLSKFQRFDREFQFMSNEESRAAYNRVFLHNGASDDANTEATTLLTTSRPNIVLFIMESFSWNFIKSLGGMDGVTPNFENLIREGIFFTNCYCSSVRTDRGIVAIESGYLAQPTTSIIKYSHKISTLPGLPKTLRQHGYDTLLVHGGDLRIFNKYEYYQQCGHSCMVGIEDFPASAATQKWGVPDHVVMEWLSDNVLHRYKEHPQQPWMITMQTLSSHIPYDVPWNILDDAEKNAFAYTDRALGQFVERMKDSPVWDNLLIICIADHSIQRHDMPPFLKKHAHIPWLMLGGAVKQPMVIDKIVNQTDLPATVLAMLGLPHGDFIFSHDVFSEAYTYPCSFNTYNNGFLFRDMHGCTLFDNNSQQTGIDLSAEREHLGKGVLQYLYNDLSHR